MAHGQDDLGEEELSDIWERALASSDEDEPQPGTSARARAEDEERARLQQQQAEQRRIAQVAQARADAQPYVGPRGRHQLSPRLRQYEKFQLHYFF